MSAADAKLRRFQANGGRYDPLVDPACMDVVEVPGYGARLVLWVAHEQPSGRLVVCYRATPRAAGVDQRQCSLKAWRDWCKGGRVVCRGVS